MKLADFFVTLGFKTDGAPELKQLENQLDELAKESAKLLAVFGSVTAAMGIMLRQATQTALGMQHFTATTGLSAQELKKWQYVAESAGVSSEGLADTIKSLQQARADIAMGRGNVAPWQLLGIAPGDNPFETLKQLRERIKDLDPAVARSITGQMGISEDVFAMLRLSNKEFEDLEQKFILNAKQQKTLSETGANWKQLGFQINAVKDRLAAELAPVLIPILKALQKLVGVGASFVDWLGKGSIAAQATKAAMIGLAVAVVAVTAALSALISAVGLFATVSSATKFLSLLKTFSALAPWLASATGWIGRLILGVRGLATALWGVATASAAAFWWAAVIAAVVLTVQDLWTGLKGGDSVFFNLAKNSRLFRVAIVSVMGVAIQFLDVIHQLSAIDFGKAWSKILDSVIDKFIKLKAIVTGVLGFVKKLFHPFAKKDVKEKTKEDEQDASVNEYDKSRSDEQDAPVKPAKRKEETFNITPMIKVAMAQLHPLSGIMAMLRKNPDPQQRLQEQALAPVTNSTRTNTIRQENNIDIQVQGGKDPYETGKRIANPLTNALSNAARQIPVPT